MCKYLTCRSWFSISLKTECDLKPSRLPSFELPDEPLVDLREEKKKKVKWKSSSARERGDRFQSSQVEIGFSDGLFMLKKYLPCKSRGKTEKATLCRSQLYIVNSFFQKESNLNSPLQNISKTLCFAQKYS